MVTAKAIIAKNVFNPAGQLRAIKAALADQAKATKRNLERDVADWDTKVVFVIRQVDEFTVEIATDNDIYRYQDDGTRPHVIRPKVKQALAFSLPRVGVIITKKVNHPGNDAQKWTLREQKIAERDLPKRIDSYLRGVL